MQKHRIDDLTSIGRPLDPRFATNRAVSRFMPVAGIVAAVVATVRGASVAEAIWTGIAALLLVLGAWALARELAPDDNAAAFVAMALGLLVLPLVVPLSLLLLFATMLLIRIVNRTVGLPARVTDSLGVTLLVFATMYLTGNAALGIVAAVAFALDATLREPLERQWVFAAVCLIGAAVAFLMLEAGVLVQSPVDSRVTMLLVAITLAYVAALMGTRVVESHGDVTGHRLAVSRVRAGMLVALLVPLQSVLLEDNGLAHSSIIWAALAGVAVTAVVIRPLGKLLRQ